MNHSEFETKFESLTGHRPLSWQRRLYIQQFATGDLPSVIDISTGLGKTMVMAIWLVARAQHPDKLPTRLIYVVDRRTVVDQATDLAQKLRDNCKQALGIEPLAISTLRGQLADNREWSRDPSRLAIIIGTVDLIGSALLFSGYRSSYKRRPLEAGLLGQDSLLVLDEAHLSRPFEKLLCTIDTEGRFQRSRDGQTQGNPLRVIRMSATGGSAVDSKPPFTLQFDINGDLTAEDAKDVTTTKRFAAKKRLTIQRLGEKEKLQVKLAQDAIDLVASTPEQNAVNGQRIVVFTRKPDDARSIADTIRKHGAKKHSPGPYADAVEVLTGTMRGLERDELVEKPVFQERWLNSALIPSDPVNQSPVFLISTSAGEVGFDLNADHMVCDATTIDSLIQRLGRVNRRGLGEAQVHLFVEPPKKGKDGKPKQLEGLDKSIATTIDLLQGVEDVSPKNIAALKSGDWKQKYTAACSPEPATVDLTDILLDAWSMTSITEPMPGRPEVGPWLRGIADDLPQTTIAWRAELDEPGFADLDLSDIQEWFDTHRILTHETLSVPTSVAAKWLTDRWDHLDDMQRSETGGRRILIDRSGIKFLSVKEVVDQLARKNTDSIRFANLILPASFGGIERHVGLLDPAAPKKPEDTGDVDNLTRQLNAKARQVAPDVADIAPGRKRQRRIEATIDGQKQEPRIIGFGKELKLRATFRIALESDDDRTTRLTSHVPKREKLEYGSEKQTLQQHVGAVRKTVDDLLSRLSLSDDFKRAAELAAEWHDHGKNRERWQRTIRGMATVGSTDWMQQRELEGDGRHQCLGKSGSEMKRDSRGYRHEFGSLREFTDSMKGTVSDEVFDLVMHLIAAHHGRGRPHFPKGAFDPDCESRSDEIHTESIRRFASLQRKYGWWHLTWLENLLRCADALASADGGAA